MTKAMTLRRGRFIVLEGLDGAGTTTQTRLISEALEALGLKVVRTFEPSEGPIGVLLRQALSGRVGLPQGAGPLSQETLALLFAADRMDHLQAVVEPALQRGDWVVCDRYVLSSLAYQGMSVPMAWVDGLNSRALKPDLTLFLEVSAQVGAKRRAQRGGVREIFDDDEKQRRISRQYLQAIRLRIPRERIVRLDGTLPLEDVTGLALAQIHKLLPVRHARSKR